MIGRLISLTVSALMLGQVASAEDLRLSDSGTFLGRVSSEDIDTAIQVTVNLWGDEPVATYVMARFQNNTPQHRIQNGEWVPWNETTADLVDSGIGLNPDGTLTFVLVNKDLSMDFLPVVFTVAYAIEDGSLKSGYMVVDR